MALNLFGPPTKDDIKVAYIDPILGLVEGVSICEANEYAKREPGTTFIFRNGNQTLQYLNVNEINQLDPTILITTDKCGGISQKKECGPPTIQIFGGGGIGAAGNPIVGNDGSILAVDIIRGGNGYQYPPLVSARDICNYGSGATFTTIIGEVVETTETYDNESDFEDYELCEPTDVGYGQNFGPDGEDLGPWDPRVYTNPGEDPIRKEIAEYQTIVRRLARTPFWTTIKNNPTRIICSDEKVSPSKYDVTHPSWGGRIVKINPVETKTPITLETQEVEFKIFGQGGKAVSGYLFTFTAVDGQHTFILNGAIKSKATRVEKIQIRKNVNYDVVASHTDGRLLEQGLIKEETKKREGGIGESNKIFADGVKTVNDNDDIQIILPSGGGVFKSLNKIKVGGRSTFDITYVLEGSSTSAPKPSTTQIITSEVIIDDTFMNKYAISPVSPSNVRGSDFAGRVFTFEWTEDFPIDGEYIFRGLCDNTAQLYIDDLKIFDLAGFDDPIKPIQKTIKKGIHEIRVDLLNIPIEEIAPGQSTVEERTVGSFFLKEGTGYYILIGGNDVVEIDFVFDWYDDENFGYALTKITIPSESGGPVVLSRPLNGTIGSSKATGTFKADKKYGPIIFEGTSSRFKDTYITNSGPAPEQKNQIIAFFDDNPDDLITNAQLVAVNARQLSPGRIISSKKIKVILYKKPGGVEPFYEANELGSYSVEVPNLSRFTRFPAFENDVAESISISDGTIVKLSQAGGEDLLSGRYKTITFKGPGTFDLPSNFTGIPLGVSSFEISNFVKIISSKSWNENPMGLALTIDAPPIPPPPQEPIPEQEGRCPNNPIWSTRFPGAKEFWYPVNYRGNLLDRELLNIISEKIQVILYKKPGGGEPFYEANLFGSYSVEVPNLSRFTKFPAFENDVAESISISAGIKVVLSQAGGEDLLSGKFETITFEGPGIFDLPSNFTGIPLGVSSFKISKADTKNSGSSNPQGWSKFLNRYAISPVRPLDTPNSDGGGIVWSNSWNIDIPYDGFYKFVVEQDDYGKIYLDGQVIKLSKVFITRGRHIIGVEIENKKSEVFNQVSQKIFRTLDWQVAPTIEERPFGSFFLKEGNSYYILIGGNDVVEIDFVFDWYDDENFGYALTKITIPSESKGPVILSRPLNGTIGSFKATGKFKADKKYGPIIFEGTSSRFEDTFITDSGPEPEQKNQIIAFFDNNPDDLITNAQLVAVNARQLSPGRLTGGLSGGISRDGVTYEGPPIFHYKDNRWGSYMNKNSISPVIPGDPADASGRKQFIWRGVNFPESGQYDIIFLADTNASLIIGGTQVLSSQGFAENPQVFKVNITQGVYDVIIDSEYPYNIPETNSFLYFRDANPTGFALEIRKNVSVLREGFGKSWKENPMGIGAILIPPPCPRRIRGKGIVTDVIVNDPGNGYLPPISPPPLPSSELTLIIIDVPGVLVPTTPDIPLPGGPLYSYFSLTENIGKIPPIWFGIHWKTSPIPPTEQWNPNKNYVPGDIVYYTPPSFGTGGAGGVGAGGGGGGGVGAGGVGAGGVGAGGAGGVGAGGAGGVGAGGAGGVGAGPAIPLFIPSPPSGPPTGINASFRPQFEVVRDPIVINAQKLLQVTDLVGLKQTGYVNGRAYYGAVYYDRGIRYAGFYETVGEPIQVYDTLRESIIAQIITPPSAILRQGTDIRSNDPLLNIPGTVQSTLSSNSIVGAGDIFQPSVPFVQEPISDPIYPVSLRLKRIIVEDPGINYNITDQIRVIPSNGAILEPIFGTFGRVIKVAVIDPGFGFTEYPRIEMFTPL